MPEEEEEIEFGGIADESFVCGSSSGNTSLESNISLESNSSVDTSSSSTSSSDSSSSIDEHDNLLDTTFAFDHWSSDDDSEDDDLDMDSDDDLFDSEGEDTLTSPHEQLVFFPPASSASSSSSPSSPSSSSPSSQSSSSSTQANSTSPFRRRPPRNPFWLHTPPPTPDPILSQLPLPKLSDVPAWAVQCYCVPPLMRGTPPRNWEEGSFGDLRMLRGRGGGYGEGSGERYGEEGVAS
ncbi:hypothetical protein K474DRAFT_1036415 [Panus rudis PR-1116 ss-1]|nr:hypothetical protein K474DRAFT_1036415 [Panus rudis PR-1116 ss-1]